MVYSYEQIYNMIEPMIQTAIANPATAMQCAAEISKFVLEQRQALANELSEHKEYPE